MLRAFSGERLGERVGGDEVDDPAQACTHRGLYFRRHVEQFLDRGYLRVECSLLVGVEDVLHIEDGRARGSDNLAFLLLLKVGRMAPVLNESADGLVGILVAAQHQHLSAQVIHRQVLLEVDQPVFQSVAPEQLQ